MKLVGELMKEFQAKTGSTKAGNILADWPAQAKVFVKVFPQEYQKVLKEQAEAVVQNNGVPDKPVTPKPVEPKVSDIEDVLPDKVRGFIKYKRETGSYRPAEKRQEDWEEIYNWPAVRKSKLQGYYWGMLFVRLIIENV